VGKETSARDMVVEDWQLWTDCVMDGFMIAFSAGVCLDGQCFLWLGIDYHRCAQVLDFARVGIAR
jgi:hypothetical protein